MDALATRFPAVLRRGLAVLESGLLLVAAVCVHSYVFAVVLEYLVVWAAGWPWLRAGLGWLAGQAGGLFDGSFGLIHHVYDRTVLTAAKQLYVHGPEVMGVYGFWGGRPPEDICAALTRVQAAHWVDHPAECLQRIDRQVGGYVIFGLAALGIMLGYRYANDLYTRSVVGIRPPPPLASTSFKTTTAGRDDVYEKHIEMAEAAYGC